MFADSEAATVCDAEQRFRDFSLLFPGELFVNLAIYVDETGIHDPTGKQPGSDVAGVAGYIARADRWVTFCGEWMRVLKNYGMEKTGFHYRDYRDEYKRHKKPGWPYYGRNDKKHEAFLHDLATVAGQKTLFGFAALVSVLDYDQLLLNADKDMYRHPYFFCLHLFMNMVLERVDEEYVAAAYPDAKVSLFLDEANQFKEHASEMYKWVKETFDTKEKLVSTVAFSRPSDVLPLQAADLLAYQMKEKLSDELYRGIPFAAGELDRRLGAEGKLLVQYYAGKRLNELVLRHNPPYMGDGI
jgi:hypothetical protein